MGFPQIGTPSIRLLFSTVGPDYETRHDPFISSDKI